jgi:hypothetical protein
VLLLLLVLVFPLPLCDEPLPEVEAPACGEPASLPTGPPDPDEETPTEMVAPPSPTDVEASAICAPEFHTSNAQPRATIDVTIRRIRPQLSSGQRVSTRSTSFALPN